MNHLTKIMISLCAIAGISSCSDKKMPEIEKIDKLMSAQFPSAEPGAAIAILRGDEVLLEKGYGLADMNTLSPVTPETFFCLASISKQFTATAILQACEKGTISLEDEVRSYFPQFTDPIWDGVRIKHLISHSSGLPDARSRYTREEKVLADDNRSLEYFDDLDWCRFLPGESYEYINPTFVLAGRILENLSGKDFNDYMRENIFNPAGMKEAVYFKASEEDRIPHRSHGYMKDEESGKWVEYDYGEETFFATRADGALYTSVHEFMQWERALRSNILISESTREDAHTPHTLVSDSPYETYNVRPNTWYGYGWFIEPATENGGKVIYHTGENGGYHNIAARYPDSNTLVVILSTRPDWDQYEMLQMIEEALNL